MSTLQIFSGLSAAIITPLAPPEPFSLHVSSFDKILGSMTPNIRAVFIGTKFGQGDQLTTDEKIELIERASNFPGLKIIVGIGDPDINKTKLEAFRLVEHVSAFLVNYSPSWTYEDYQRLMNTSYCGRVPTIIANSDGENDMPAHMALDIVHHFKTVAGILGSSSDLEQELFLAQAIKAAGYRYWMGNDKHLFEIPHEYCEGFVSTLVQTFPSDVQAAYAAHANNDLNTANIRARFAELCDLLPKGVHNALNVTAYLHLIGLCYYGYTRTWDRADIAIDTIRSFTVPTKL